MIRIRLVLIPLYTVAAACGLLSGCSRRVPSATVVLVDPSGSVTERARKDEFAAVAALIPRMQRGDLLTIIPITDNAAADIEGRVLRLHAPERREAYDTDLRRFRDDAERQYAGFASNLLAHPGQRTDILGALDVARQEFEDIPTTDKRKLIVLSDFLEDDGTYRFVSDRRLARLDRATQLSEYLGNEHELELPNVKLHLGAMQSEDFAQLDRERQNAVRAFWHEYFSSIPNDAEIRMDGGAALGEHGDY